MIEAKIIFSFLIILLLFSVLRLNFSNQLRINEKLIFIIIFPFIFLIIFNPSLLDLLADLIKVERGRDLLFYFYREHSIITSRLGGGGVSPFFVMQRDAKRGGVRGTFLST